MAQDGSKMASEDSRLPLRSLKIAQRGFRQPTTCPPIGSNTAPRRLKVAQELPKEAPEKPKSFKETKKTIVSMLLACSRSMGY